MIEYNLGFQSSHSSFVGFCTRTNLVQNLVHFKTLTRNTQHAPCKPTVKRLTISNQISFVWFGSPLVPRSWTFPMHHRSCTSPGYEAHLRSRVILKGRSGQVVGEPISHGDVAWLAQVPTASQDWADRQLDSKPQRFSHHPNNAQRNIIENLCC